MNITEYKINLFVNGSSVKITDTRPALLIDNDEWAYKYYNQQYTISYPNKINKTTYKQIVVQTPESRVQTNFQY